MSNSKQQPGSRVSNSSSAADPVGGLTRRGAMGRMAAGGTVGALAVSGVASGSVANPAASAMMQMGSDQWNSFVGQQFQVSGQDGRSNMRLEEVIDETRSRKKDPARPRRLRSNSVSLLFSTDRELDDSALMVAHPRLGRSQLFFHRTVRDNHGNRVVYQVVLN